MLRRFGVQEFGRQTPGLGTKHQGVPRAVADIRVEPGAAGREQQQTTWACGADKGREVRMDAERHPFVVIKPSAAQKPVFKYKPEGFYEM